MHAALRLAVVLCTASIVARRVLLYSCASDALRTDDAMQICGLSASLKLSARTCKGLVKQALRIEKDAFAKIKDTEESLRAASRRVTEMDTMLVTLPDALRGVQADLMVVERAVDDAWSKYDTLRVGIRALVRRAAAIVPKATASAGRIDNFITAFATAESRENFRCVTELGDPSISEYANKNGRRKGPNPPATLHGNLTGCTYENYTLARPQNITTTIVNDVVILGEDGMLCMGGYTTFKNSMGKACPFLLNDFVRKDGTPMNWGGFWLAEQSSGVTVIRFNREKRRILLDVAREFGELKWLLSDGSRRDGRWLRTGREVPKTIRQLAAEVGASLLIVRHGSGPSGDVKKVVDALVKEVERVQISLNTSELKISLFKRPERRRRGRRTTSATVAGNKGVRMLPLYTLSLFAVIA
ncbi:hypothetical protein ERJ75_001205900 [Trypanosoma vivax]|nr:hypothetical protein TRVL_09310 [Trypanosoma vivax]KAH8609391.1 hypothetical protein ERJ75_001205900 [Trypanosoma vivax]